MRQTWLVTVALVTLTGSATAQTLRIPNRDVRVWWSPATARIFPGDKPGSHSFPVRLFASRNEWEPFQLVFAAGPGADVELALQADGLAGNGAIIPKERFEFFREEYVPVRTWEGRPLETPRLTPDPLPVLEGPLALKPGVNQGVWVNLRVPKDIPAGTYRGNLIATCGTDSVKIPVELEVWDFTMPDAPHTESAFFVYTHVVGQYYGISGKTLDKVDDEFYWFQADHWLPPPVPPVSLRSEEAARYLDSPVHPSFRIPYDDRNLGELHDYLAQKGWLKRGFFYVVDEPNPEDFPRVCNIGNHIFAAATDWRYLITAPPRPELLNCVNLWCPNVWSATNRSIAERQAAGDQVWWYTCDGSTSVMPTFALDDAAVCSRLLFWLQSWANYTGALYWTTTYWVKEPPNGTHLSQSMKPDVYDEPARVGDLSNVGGGVLIWPSRDGTYAPVASIRLKLIREGLEDYEYLYELRQRLQTARQSLGWTTYDPKRRCDEIVNRIASSYKHYTTRAADLYETRRSLAGEITRTLEHPLLLLRTEPADGGYQGGSSEWISGRAEKGAAVSINGKPVAVDQWGEFQRAVTLKPGPNEFRIKASLGGQTKVETRTLNLGRDVRWRTPVNPPASRQVEVGEAMTPPVIDGDLADAAWKTATRVGSFVLADGTTKPDDPTEVLLLSGKDALYVGFVCHEANMDQLKLTYSQRDSWVWRDDSVEIFLDPDGNGLSYYQLVANADGVMYDLRELRDDLADAAWNGSWGVRTKKSKDRWTAEFQIPYATIGAARPPKGKTWLANFARSDRAGRVQNSCWGPTAIFADPQAFGALRFR